MPNRTRHILNAMTRILGVIQALEYPTYVGLGLVFLISTVLQVRTSLYAAPTPDEVAHLPAGLSIWQTGQFDAYKVNPPLVKLIAAAPVLLMNPKTDWSHARPSTPSSRIEFAVGRDFVAQNREQSISYFRAARLACLPFNWIGILTTFVWARALAGSASGLVAAALLGFSPMFLGHGSLITPDVAAATLGVAAFYRFRKWLIESNMDNTILLGLCTGLCLLTKFTWAIIFPCSAILLVPFWRGASLRTTWQRDFAHLSLASILALIVINSAYGFDQTFSALGEIEFISKTLRPPESPDTTVADEIIEKNRSVNRFSGTAIHWLPIPVPEIYLKGIDLQKVDFEHPSQSYLLGEWRSGGWWYYYIVGFLTKELEITILLLLVTLAGVLWRAMKWLTPTRDCSTVSTNSFMANHRPFMPHDAPAFREFVVLLVPALIVFLLVSSQSNMNHHVRYVLPGFPFIHLLASLGLTFLSGGLRKFIIAGLCLQIVTTIVMCPHYLAYFNTLTRTIQHGNPPLLSSNFDWGQDIAELVRWQRTVLRNESLHVAVSTHYDPSDLGLSYELPPPFGTGPSSVPDKSKPQGPQPGWFAISQSILMGERCTSWKGRRVNSSDLQYFSRLTPVSKLGSTIWIYHISSEQAENLRTELEAEMAGNCDENGR